MNAPATQDLNRLATALGAGLRREAAALEGNRAGNLCAVADQLDGLIAVITQHPDDLDARRVLLQVLSEVEAFHARIQEDHAATKAALLGAAERRAAGQAYGEARRYGDAGAGS
ncbi:MAG: hypothetical protein EA356_02495 [Geminicoccaceae bacterium]|nr:MAG: hypothetical protein EA356_02495 [Geminicoccaceae bacterium]